MIKLITTRQYNTDGLSEYEESVNKLENRIQKYQDSLIQGCREVSDSTFDTCINYLKALKPNSPLLNSNKHLIVIPELNEEAREILNREVALEEPIDIFDEELEEVEEEIKKVTFMLNPKGINVRIIYENGVLLEAKTFGIGIGEINITEKITQLFGDTNINLLEIPKIEVIGVLAIPYSAVDLIVDYFGTEDTYISLFKILTTNVLDELGEDAFDIIHFICMDIVEENLIYTERADILAYAETLGYLIAECLTVEVDGTVLNAVDTALYEFEYNEDYVDYEYDTNGIQLITEDKDKIIFITAGKWGKPKYVGVVEEIKWVNYQEEKIPLIVLENEIEVEEGVVIKEIPLKLVNLLIILEIQTGSKISFNYIGDGEIILYTKKDELVIF